MQSITVQHKQCNIDIALLAFGTIERLFELPHLIANESITDELVVGTVIQNIANADFDKTIIVRALNQKQNIPASSKNNDAEVVQKQGIGHWIIGQNFKVS